MRRPAPAAKRVSLGCTHLDSASCMDQRIYSKVRSGVCAIGALRVSQQEFIKAPDAPQFTIIGTGFLVRDTTVFTNRHVVLAVKAFAEKHRIPADRLYLQFNYGVARGHHQQGWCRFGKHGFMSNQNLDIGVIEFVRRPEPSFAVCQPLDVVENLEIPIGVAVAALGFPYGTSAQQRETGAGEKIYRFGPVLQQGYLSAIAPFDEANRAERLLLDVRTSGGMSGSPVFLPDSGEVIGILDAGIEDTIAFAIPLTRARIEGILRLHDETPIGTVRGSPVATVPRRPNHKGVA